MNTPIVRLPRGTRLRSVQRPMQFVGDHRPTLCGEKNCRMYPYEEYRQHILDAYTPEGELYCPIVGHLRQCLN